MPAQASPSSEGLPPAKESSPVSLNNSPAVISNCTAEDIFVLAEEQGWLLDPIEKNIQTGTAEAIAAGLFDYQHALVDRVFASTAKRLLIVLPTGGGKTRVANAIMAQEAEEFIPSLFLAHRIEIVRQTSDELIRLGVPHGVVAADLPERYRPNELIQIGMVQTVHARGIKRKKLILPPAKRVWIDECHHTVANSYREIIEAYPDAIIRGLTATPARGDGRGLGDDFDELIEGVAVKELIAAGRLVQTRILTHAGPDLTGIRTQQGDYSKGQLEQRMNTDKLVGSIVGHWLKHAEGRKTVAFAAGVQHSLHIRDEFLKVGVRAAHIDGDTPTEEREEILCNLRDGQLDLVSNCLVFTEGWDCPPVSCLVLARPTKQMGLYRQMVGRVLRAHPGKTDALIIDHAGAVLRHGRPEDDILWTLAPDKPAVNVTAREYEKTGGDRWVECQCGCMREGGMACTNCGFLPPRKAKEFQVSEGWLKELSPEDEKEMTRAEQIAFYRQLVGHYQKYNAETSHKRAYYACLEKGFKPDWSWRDYEALEPEYAAVAWAKHCHIKYVKSLRRAA